MTVHGRLPVPRDPPRAAGANSHAMTTNHPTTGGTGTGRFSIVALSGKPILNHWFWGTLGVELTGIEGKPTLPVLLHHDPGQRIGVSDARSIAPRRGLTMQGHFLRSSALAERVRGESRDGFPWEASVRLQPLKLEQIPVGASTTVNGETMQGPGYVFRRSLLREVSFAVIGADVETTAAALMAAQPDQVDHLVRAARQQLDGVDTSGARATAASRPRKGHTGTATIDGGDLAAMLHTDSRLVAIAWPALLALGLPTPQGLDGHRTATARCFLDADRAQAFAPRWQRGDADELCGSVRSRDLARRVLHATTMALPWCFGGGALTVSEGRLMPV